MLSRVVAKNVGDVFKDTL